MSDSAQPTPVEINPWEDRWSQGKTGWDQGFAHPELVSLLSSEESSKLEIPTSGRAAVPGCGMGYDVLLLAQHGLKADGLDISPTGAKTAEKWLSEQSVQPTTGAWNIICTDFFTYSPEHSYDVIFDYTFLCAIPPSLREDWAKQMKALSNPSTRLITMMFPLPTTPDGPIKEGGPPFGLREGDYHTLLDGDWELIWIKRLEKGARSNGALGGEALGVWKRR